MNELNVSYWVYIVMLFILTGWFLLSNDAKKYTEAGMHKESRAARIMAWINITIGLAFFILQVSIGLLFEQ